MMTISFLSGQGRTGKNKNYSLAPGREKQTKVIIVIIRNIFFSEITSKLEIPPDPDFCMPHAPLIDMKFFFDNCFLKV